LCNQVKWNGTTTVTLSYDVENRVSGISYAGGGSNSFTYNGLNLRTGKVDSGGTKSYVTDGISPASAVLKDGAAVYTPGISERRGSTSSFYHADSLGSTRNITGSTQTSTDTHQTDAFGNSLSRTGTNPTPFLFAGQHQYQADSQSGLMLLGNRYYDAEAGRFLSKDLIKDGDNWYAYCQNNPLSRVDFSGNEWRWVTGLKIWIGSWFRQPKPPPLPSLPPQVAPPTLMPHIPAPPLPYGPGSTGPIHEPILPVDQTRYPRPPSSFGGRIGSGGSLGGIVVVAQGTGVLADGMREVIRYRKNIERYMDAEGDW